MSSRIAAASVLVLVVGCAPLTGSDVIASAYVPDESAPIPVTELDLLLMIDNSCSLTEEQASVVTELGRIIPMFLTGDLDGDGVAEGTPVSLHVGIVDSDMGLGDVTDIATCSPGFGDDGLMQIRARHPASDCMTDYGPSYLDPFFHGDPSSRPLQLAEDIACVATLGTNGCGFEHQLESPLKALTPRPLDDGTSPVAWTADGYRPPTFRGGTFGHGGDPQTNADFLRPDSVLAIVLVTDEDDCSTPNTHIFSPTDPAYVDVDLNLRCHAFASELQPIERYADGFLGLRRDPRRLVFAAIAGVPTSVAGMPASTILADPNMNERVNPMMTNQLLPACVSPGGRGVAYPAIRITQVAGALADRGARTTVQSVCNTDFTAAFTEIVLQIEHALDPTFHG